MSPATCRTVTRPIRRTRSTCPACTLYQTDPAATTGSPLLAALGSYLDAAAAASAITWSCSGIPRTVPIPTCHDQPDQADKRKQHAHAEPGEQSRSQSWPIGRDHRRYRDAASRSDIGTAYSRSFPQPRSKLWWNCSRAANHASFRSPDGRALGVLDSW